MHIHNRCSTSKSRQKLDMGGHFWKNIMKHYKTCTCCILLVVTFETFCVHWHFSVLKINELSQRIRSLERARFWLSKPCLGYPRNFLRGENERRTYYLVVAPPPLPHSGIIGYSSFIVLCITFQNFFAKICRGGPFFLNGTNFYRGEVQKKSS